MMPRSTGSMMIWGSFTTILVWAVKEFAQVVIPSEVAAAITAVATGLAGHFTSD